MTSPYEDSLPTEDETHTAISTGDANDPWIDVASGETLLHNAAYRWDVARVSSLLEEGASPFAVNNRGSTPVDYAVCEARQWQWEKKGWPNGHDCASILRLLVARGARLDHKDANGATLLHNHVQGLIGTGLEVEGGLKEMFHVLLEHGNPVDSADGAGYTALHRAAGVGNEKAVEVLVKDCGANIEARTNRKGTALHVAIERGYGKETGLLLIQLGADEEAKDASGRIPKELIAEGMLMKFERNHGVRGEGRGRGERRRRPSLFHWGRDVYGQGRQGRGRGRGRRVSL